MASIHSDLCVFAHCAKTMQHINTKKYARTQRAEQIDPMKVYCAIFGVKTVF